MLAETGFEIKVKSVLLKLAEVRNEDSTKLAEIVWENTCRLYNLEA
jgi:Tat protein secretion system quality control protein TatD with DNase activity